MLMGSKYKKKIVELKLDKVKVFKDILSLYE